MSKCFVCGGIMKSDEMMVLEVFEDHYITKGEKISIHEWCYDFAFSNPKGKIGMCDDCHRVVIEIKKMNNLQLCKNCMDLRDRGKPKGEPPLEPPF